MVNNHHNFIISMAENLIVANRYTKAIFELANAKKCVDAVLKDLEQISDVIVANKSQKSLLIGSAVPVRIKKMFWALLLKNLKLHKISSSLIDVLLEHNRMDLLSIMHKNFDKLVKNQTNVMSFELTSAKPVDAKVKKEIATELKNIFSKKIDIEENIDPKLLGGFLISSGSMMLDCSMKGRLEKIRQGFNTLQS